MTRRAVIMIMLVLFLFVGIPAAWATDRQQTILVHVTTLLDGGSDRTALVPQVIAEALKKGYKVVLLFDAEGVLSIKMGRWFGGHSTPLDRVDITRKERQHLSGLLGTTPEGIPEIYGSLLHFFKGKGVAIYVNKQALLLHRIDDDHFDHAAEAVGEDRIVELLNGAGIYVSY